MDQLGIRATAIRMYSHLVPGITNVTERARYFSIHPYAVHLWAKGLATTEKTKFQRLVRRVECLVALGEKIRVRGSDEESPGIVGTVRIGRWLRNQPYPLTDNRSGRW